MFKLNSLMINTGNLEQMKSFYKQVFGSEMDEMGGWLVGGTYLGLMEHSEVSGKNDKVSRIMFNLESEDVQNEFERISKIEGVEVIKEPYQMEGWDGWIATLSDPDGNYFQLISPWDGNTASN